MSKHTHDPIIDPTEDSDFDNEALPPTTDHEHLDLATTTHDTVTILGGVFNGDSLVTVSPFKKSYSNNSIEESASLVDEPLPIEAVALSPFRIEPLRNSPLSSRSKDPHSFSVEVPDSLPSHVMELDSPEHDYDDYDNDFNIESATTPVNKDTEDNRVSEYDDLSNKLQDFFSQDNAEVNTQMLRKQPDIGSEKVKTSLITEDYNKNSEENNTLLSDTQSLPENFSEILFECGTSSQVDLFESQSVEVEKQAINISQSSTTEMHHNPNFLCDNRPSTSASNFYRPPAIFSTESLPLLEENVSLTNRHVQEHTEESDQSNKASLSAVGNSPTKRKRESSEEYRDGLEKKLLKTDPASADEGGSDSDVEFLTDISRDQSIEVVYEKKKGLPILTEHECADSQDLKLILTGNTQNSLGSSEAEPHYLRTDVLAKNIENKKKLSCSSSTSLISLPESGSLTCRDSLSSSIDQNTQRFETTISATQVETLCKPAILSQPNIERLLDYPINDKKSFSNKDNNSGQCTNELCSQVVTESLNPMSQMSQQVELTSEKTSILSDDTQVLIVPKSHLSSKSSSVNKEAESLQNFIPHFATPSQAVSQEETSESIFAKASKAAFEKLEGEKNICNSSVKNSESDIFDSSPEVESKTLDNLSHSNESDNIGNSSSHSTPLFVTCLGHSQSTPISSHEVQEKSSTWLFPNKVNKDEDGKLLQSSQTYVEDSDDEQKTKDEIIPKIVKPHNKKHDLKASTPNNSSDISPVIFSDGQSSISKVTEINSTVNSSDDHCSPAVINNLSNTPMQEVYIDVASMDNINDLHEAGWRKVGPEKVIIPIIEKWVDPVTMEVAHTYGGNILKKNTSWMDVISFAVEGSSKGHSRISDISSISAGYLGDKSSSVHSFGATRLESTRLSSASITSVGFSYDNHPGETHFHAGDNEDKTCKSDGEFFIPPKPLRKPLMLSVTKPLLTNKSTSDEIVSPPEFKPKRPRGRGRPRGRSRGRGRSVAKNASLPVTTIKEDESEYHSLNDDDNECEVLVENCENKIKDKNDEIKFLKKGGASVFPPPTNALPEDEIIKYLPEEMKQALLEAQIPLSEEEEEIFTQGYKLPAEDTKVQYEEVLRKVRVAEIQVNTLVFARYVDGLFYSAIVKEAAKDKWVVKYNLDNCVSSVREVYILPTDILPKGLSCFVRHANRNYSDPGIVVGHILNSDPRLHLIETYKGVVLKVTHSHIMLKAAVANELLEVRRAFHSLVASPGVDVSLDNIIVGKTRQESKSPLKPLKKASKPDSNLDSTNSEEEKKTIKVTTLASSSSDSFEDPSRLLTPKSSKKPSFASSRTPKTPKTPKSRTRTPKTLKNVVKSAAKSLKLPELVVEDSPSGTIMNPTVELIQLQEAALSPKSTPKKRGRKPGSGQNPKKILKADNSEECHEEVNPMFGKLPDPDCNILKGYKILITYPDNPNSNTEQGEAEVLDLNKDYLKKQITLSQGQVLESFSEAQILYSAIQPKKSIPQQCDMFKLSTLPASESPTQFLCVSNTYSLTAKFIQCLTVGIPIVNFQWISHSISKNQCLNWYHYLLPAGLSLLTGQMMEQSWNDTFKNIEVGKVAEVLQDEKVFLATSSNAGFKNLWATLLSTASASVFAMPVKGGNIQRLLDRRTSVVIADSSIPPEEEKRAQEVGVPIVSSQWFIQSLLARCKLPYDAHVEFDYKYKKDKHTQDKAVR